MLRFCVTSGDKKKHKVLLVLSNKERAFLALPEYLIQALNCPNDLEFSSSRDELLSLTSRYSWIRKDNLVPVETENVT